MADQTQPHNPNNNQFQPFDPAAWQVFINNTINDKLNQSLPTLQTQVATQVGQQLQAQFGETVTKATQAFGGQIKSLEEQLAALKTALEAHKKLGEDVSAIKARFEKDQKEGWWKGLLYVAGTVAAVFITQAVYNWLFASDDMSYGQQVNPHYANGTTSNLGMAPMVAH